MSGCHCYEIHQIFLFSIKESGEFAINIPHVGLAKQVRWCGTVSGKRVDKFQESGLTPLPAKLIKAPLIKECIGHLECHLKRIYPVDEHAILVGKVVRATVDSNLFNGHWILNKARTIHYLGNQFFGILENRIKI